MLIASPRSILTQVPPVAVATFPTRITCPVLAVIVKISVVSTIKATLSPSVGEAGSVAVDVAVMK